MKREEHIDTPREYYGNLIESCFDDFMNWKNDYIKGEKQLMDEFFPTKNTVQERLKKLEDNDIATIYNHCDKRLKELIPNRYVDSEYIRDTRLKILTELIYMFYNE